jgi:hypothetical protein
MAPKLDRRVPSDWAHVDRFHIRGLVDQTVAVAEHTIRTPDYRDAYNQLDEGACVSFGESWQLSIKRWRRYDPWWHYPIAQSLDEYPDTPPEGGTSLRAGYDVLRTLGHRRFFHNIEKPVELDQGIAANRWATTVDEVRTAIANDDPVAFGINWYTNFDAPVLINGEWWIGLGDNWGSIRGGHCLAAFRVSDRRAAVGPINSWGKSYPLVWLPYAALDRLLREDGECGIITPR